MRIGVPKEGYYKEVLNTDAKCYGGSNLGNMGGLNSEKYNVHNYGFCLNLCLPPLCVLVFKYDQNK